MSCLYWRSPSQCKFVSPIFDTILFCGMIKLYLFNDMFTFASWNIYRWQMKYLYLLDEIFFYQMRNSCCPLSTSRQSDCELYIFLPYCPERKTSIGINPRKAINSRKAINLRNQERKFHTFFCNIHLCIYHIYIL